VLAVLWLIFRGNSVVIFSFLCIPFSVGLCVLYALIVVARSVIVAQAFDPISAILESVSLCKKHICYVFCSMFVWMQHPVLSLASALNCFGD